MVICGVVEFLLCLVVLGDYWYVYSIQGACCRSPRARYRYRVRMESTISMTTDHWLLTIGYWRLAIGY